VKKADTLLVVKFYETTGKVDICVVGLRENGKGMGKFAKTVNFQDNTKIKINPNGY